MQVQENYDEQQKANKHPVLRLVMRPIGLGFFR